MAAGSLAEGTYNVTTNDALEENTWVAGYDTEFWGMKMENWGTCWWTVADGKATAEKLTEGTVEVSVDGDDYTIEGDFGSLKVKYTGPITLPQE